MAFKRFGLIWEKAIETAWQVPKCLLMPKFLSQQHSHLSTGYGAGQRKGDT